ncbi:MAG: hypothetical protein ABIE22_04600 [archaeon]
MNESKVRVKVFEGGVEPQALEGFLDGKELMAVVPVTLSGVVNLDETRTAYEVANILHGRERIGRGCSDSRYGAVTGTDIYIFYRENNPEDAKS